MIRDLENVFVIVDCTSAQGLLFSLSPKGGHSGTNGIWVDQLEDALQFARPQDAAAFCKVYLRHYIDSCLIKSVKPMPIKEKHDS